METILIINDDIAFCRMLVTFLEKRGFLTDVAISTDTALNKLFRGRFDLILTDRCTPDKKERTVLPNKEYPGSRIIFITDYPENEFAAKIVKDEVFACLSKPVHPDRLIETINKALALNSDNPFFSTNTEKVLAPIGKRSHIKGKSKSFSRFVSGISEVSKKLNYYIKLVAPTAMSVLITGESGSGKEYTARQIHDLSPWRHHPFLAMDCANLNLFTLNTEDEGMTNIIKTQTDRFKTANGGTLFIDGIEHLNYKLQDRLLRTLNKQFKSFHKNAETKPDVRIIATTNEDVEKAVKNGKFHAGLYQFLNEFSIVMPSLKERGEDIIIFLDYFLEKANQDLDKKVIRFSEEVLMIFQRYSWPGNLRELRNYIKQAVLLSETDSITKAELPNKLARAGAESDNFFPLNPEKTTSQNKGNEVVNKN